MTRAERELGFGGSIRRYLRDDLRGDLIAGLTVAVMGVPQAMAYALIAGLPPVYGLYTAIVSCVVAALLGSSRHLVTGPTNALCMVVLSLTAHLPERYGLDLLDIVLLLTFMTGAIQLLFGVLRLGGIVRYVSHSVVAGFTAGAGILIAANQIKNVLGVEISAHAERFHEVVIATVAQAPHTNWNALTIGVLTAVIVLVAPRVSRRLPAALLGVAVTGGLCYLLGWHLIDGAGRVEIVKDIEPISGSLPGFQLPALLLDLDYELTRELGTGAVALAILGLVEAASIARAVAAQSGQRLDFTREFVGQGASNVAGSMFSCFAGSGSFTRTAVCFQSGGRTRMAATFSALFTLLAVVFLGGVADHIPKPALAGILVVIAYSMIDKNRLRMTWRSGAHPRLVLVGTFTATLLLPLEFAVFVGVFLSLVIVLRTTGKTDLTQLVPRADQGFDELPFNRAAPSPVVTINMEGALYFAAAEDLDYELLKSLTPETRVMVLRMKRLQAVGSTAMSMLEHFWRLLKARGIVLVVCGIGEELERVMTGSGLRKQIGEQNIFYADNKLHQSTELALARAWSIVRRQQRTLEAERSSPEPAHADTTAVDLMTTRAIRFGNQHQLREAVWLMSEMLKHTRSMSPQPLFLQDREARLFGELSPWIVLATLAEHVGRDRADLSDTELAEVMRRNFTKPIRDIARTEVPSVLRNTSFASVLATYVDSDLELLPICDGDGRIHGLVSGDDLLRHLHRIVSSVESKEGGDG